jgi:hypothetical protein
VEVLLDGKPVRVARPTLAEALRAGAAEAGVRGRIVIEVKADGVRVPDDRLAAPSEELAAVRKVELVSVDPRQLVGATLADAAEALDFMAGEQQTTAELVHAGRTSEALEKLGTIFATWSAAREAVHRGGAVLGVDLTAIPLDDEGATIGALAAELGVHLRAVRDAVEQEDWSALGDALAYDLDAAAKGWSRGLRVLSGKVQGLTRGGGS